MRVWWVLETLAALFKQLVTNGKAFVVQEAFVNVNKRLISAKFKIQYVIGGADTITGKIPIAPNARVFWNNEENATNNFYNHQWH